MTVRKETWMTQKRPGTCEVTGVVKARPRPTRVVA